MAKRLQARLDELLHELDMMVFRLERDPTSDVDALHAERSRVRHDLERLRDQVGDLLREL